MDNGSGPVGWSVLFAAALLIDFLMAAYDAAVRETSDQYLQQQSREGRTRADRILKLKDAPADLMHGNWFYLILTAVPVFGMLSEFAGVRRAGVAVAAFVFVYLFGRSIPGMVGYRYAKAVCMKLYAPVRALTLIALPFTRALMLISQLLVRLIGINPKDLEDEVTEDEIISMVNEGHEQGVLDEHEAEMIQNIFQLNDKEARDIMTHRKNISGISGESALSEAISFMVEATNSRFPVYEETIDNIIGVLHLKDAMLYHHKQTYDDWLIRDIPDLLRPVNFIPETRSIDELFRSMQAKKMQMVVVVDEYGETAGLVTMEDILEEIVGNIMDEYDEDERFIMPQEDGSFLMAGMTPLKEVEETLDILFHEEDYDTLNGYLVYRLDRIPGPEEHSVIEAFGWEFHIQEVESRMIKWVRVKKKKSS